MDFKDEQKMIQEVSRKFASKEIAPLATYEKEDSFPSKEIIKKTTWKSPRSQINT